MNSIYRLKEITRVVKEVTGVAMLLGIVVMTMLMVASDRYYRSYDGNFYETGYWWQTLVLSALVICAVALLLERNPYVDVVIIGMSVVATVTFAVVVWVNSRWGVVKLLDNLAGGNGRGVVLVVLLPFVAIGMIVAFDLLGGFMAHIDRTILRIRAKIAIVRGMTGVAKAEIKDVESEIKVNKRKVKAGKAEIRAIRRALIRNLLK